MSDNRNMILAVVLSAIVLLGWGFVSQSLFPDRQPAGDQDREGQARSRSPQPQADPAAETPQAIRDRAIVLAETPRVRDRDAAPRRLDQPAAAPGSTTSSSPPSARRSTANSPPIRLFSPSGAPDSYFGEFGWIGPAGRRAHGRDGLAGERRPADARRRR